MARRRAALEEKSARWRQQREQLETERPKWREAKEVSENLSLFCQHVVSGLGGFFSAYPIGARNRGQGVGAVRHCKFSTGTFEEPTTDWDRPNLLRFDVSTNRPPMKELSPYKNLDAPHLDGYFISHKGQFKLEPLPGGGTRLEGTTWYQHSLWPAGYWKLWSDWIIHKIHRRVLRHIKALAEE